MTSKKILTLHPDPEKTGVNIDRAKYDVIRAAALKVLERNETMKPMAFLHAIGEEVDPNFDGSATWYGESIKLDMEARGELEHDRKKGVLWTTKTPSKLDKSVRGRTSHKEVVRCGWAEGDVLYEKYHDEEWGVPVHDDTTLFEFLILEGAQAGLSWITILKRREGYRRVFKDFDVQEVAVFTEEDIQAALQDAGIIRNKLKVRSTVKNAQVFITIQKEFGSFADYLWGFVDDKPITNNPKTLKDVPASTELSDHISKDLKKRGMSFVGTTIVYAYLQAVGLIDDHILDCRRRQH